LIWLQLTADAPTPLGTVGFVVSAALDVVAAATFEYEEMTLLFHMPRTR
jgi:hypothetical protein